MGPMALSVSTLPISLALTGIAIPPLPIIILSCPLFPCQSLPMCACVILAWGVPGSRSARMRLLHLHQGSTLPIRNCWHLALELSSPALQASTTRQSLELSHPITLTRQIRLFTWLWWSLVAWGVFLV